MKFKLRITSAELLFCSAIFLELLAMQLDITTLPHQMEQIRIITKGLRYTAYVFIFSKVLISKYTTKEFLLLIVLMCIMGIRIHYVGKVMFLIFIFIFGMKGIRFERMAKSLCIFLFLTLAIILLGTQFGLIENWGYNLDSARPRYALGYYYPSHATSVIFFAILLLCYNFREKLKLWHIFILELFNYWQYTNTDSRTGTILIGIALIVFYLLKYLRKDLIKAKICMLLSWSFPLSAVVSVLGALLYDKTSVVWLQLNNFTSRRLELAHEAIYKYGVCLWGQKIEWVGYGGVGHQIEALTKEYNYVDCSYVKILLQEGVVFWLLVLIGFTLASIYAAQIKDVYLCFALAFTAGYSIMEPRLCDIAFNPFMFMLVVLIDYKGNFIKLKRIKGIMDTGV